MKTTKEKKPQMELLPVFTEGQKLLWLNAPCPEMLVVEMGSYDSDTWHPKKDQHRQHPCGVWCNVRFNEKLPDWIEKSDRTTKCLQRFEVVYYNAQTHAVLLFQMHEKLTSMFLEVGDEGTVDSALRKQRKLHCVDASLHYAEEALRRSFADRINDLEKRMTALGYEFLHSDTDVLS